MRLESMGMSYELADARVEDMRAEIWRLTRVTFTGAAILLREKAAYRETSFRMAELAVIAAIRWLSEEVAGTQLAEGYSLMHRGHAWLAYAGPLLAYDPDRPCRPISRQQQTSNNWKLQ